MPQISSTLISPITTPSYSPGQGVVGPQATLDQDPFGLTTLQYPSTVGSSDCPHYITFNINLPTSSKYLGTGANPAGDNQSAAAQNFDLLASLGKTFTPPTNAQVASAAIAGAVMPSAGVLQLDPSSIGGSAAGFAAAGVTTQGITLQPKLDRIATSISIYMPDTVAFSYDQDWQAVSLTEALGKLGAWTSRGANLRGFADTFMALGSTAWQNFIGNRHLMYNNAIQAELAGSIAQSTGVLGPNFTDITLKSVGRAINPQFEMIFRGTKNRQYNFIFHFQARSQQEAATIYAIIKAFRMYAAPEIASEGSGRYFIPPGEFDIRYYFQNNENLAIARTSTCALTSITTNYAGAGQFATFNDGNPVDIELNLSFTEIDIIYRELIDKFGY